MSTFRSICLSFCRIVCHLNQHKLPYYFRVFVQEVAIFSDFSGTVLLVSVSGNICRGMLPPIEQILLVGQCCHCQQVCTYYEVIQPHNEHIADLLHIFQQYCGVMCCLVAWCSFLTNSKDGIVCTIVFIEGKTCTYVVSHQLTCPTTHVSYDNLPTFHIYYFI